ncbi:MAG: EMC3/TMCO1 family protein [Methanobrevibacter sp.]|nr:EMC3/TMCO1 family protein [Methanobrevibacter sp.]
MDILAGIFGYFNQIFDPIIALDPNPKNPLLTIFLVALIISFITQIAQKYLMDHERLDTLKKEIAEFQKKMNDVRKSGDTNATNKLQSQQSDFMKAQSEMMMMSFKPMLVTFVPILLIFWWMRSSPLANVYISLPLLPFWNILAPIWQPLLHWAPNPDVVFTAVGYHLPNAVGFFCWYFLCSLALSQVVRKLVGLKSAF